MSFNPQLERGEVVNNERITEIFRCAPQGGMRRSLKTNTLVLISDYTNDLYPDVKSDPSGIWYFCGMGSEGEQIIEYRQNKTLYESNLNSVELHLFVKQQVGNEYTYIGKMLLVNEPKQKPYFGRNILLFPLIEAGKVMDITEFLLLHDHQELEKLKIIDGVTNYLSGEEYLKLINLMEKKSIDTLVGNDGWFLNTKGYFFNQFSKRKEWGNIELLLEEKKIKKSDIFIGQNKYINPFFKNSLVYSEQHNLKREVKHNLKEQVFRIQSLNIELNDELYKVKLSEIEEINKNRFYTTLLIGPNGSGKSVVLSSIQKIFLDIYLMNISKPIQYTKGFNFEITYTIDDIQFSIKKEKNKITFSQGSIQIGLKGILIPERVISCAFTIQDRFTNKKDKANLLDEYHYFGVKNQNFKDLTDKLSRNIINATLTDREFLYNFKNITDFLGFDPELKIVLNFNKKNINIFNSKGAFLKDKNGNISLKDLEDFFYSLESKRELNNHRNSVFTLTNESLEINFEFSDAKAYEEMYEDFEIVIKQIEIGLFEKTIIMMKKNHRWFSIENSSSGEFQYISNMINILSKVKYSSLILIDEPETSLHPNWQFKYIHVLEKIFQKYKGCHFIFATHSHFLVSDLRNDSSSLIELTKQLDNTRESRRINDFVYGRSAEDILYEVFNMPTSRNYYLANDLDEILKAISLNAVDSKIQMKVDKLLSVKEFLKVSDPLYELIEVIHEKVKING